MQNLAATPAEVCRKKLERLDLGSLSNIELELECEGSGRINQAVLEKEKEKERLIWKHH